MLFLEARNGFKVVRVGGGSTNLKEMEYSIIKMRVIPLSFVLFCFVFMQV